MKYLWLFYFSSVIIKFSPLAKLTVLQPRYEYLNRTAQNEIWNKYFHTMRESQNGLNLLAAVGSPLPPNVRIVTGPFGQYGRPAVEFTPQSYIGRWAKDILPVPFYKDFGIKVTLFLQSIYGGVLFNVLEFDHLQVVLGLNIIKVDAKTQAIEFIYKNTAIEGASALQLSAIFNVSRFDMRWTVFSISVHGQEVSLYFNGCQKVFTTLFKVRRTDLDIKTTAPIFLGMAGWYIKKPALFGAIYDMIIYKDFKKVIPSCAIKRKPEYAYNEKKNITRNSRLKNENKDNNKNHIGIKTEHEDIEHEKSGKETVTEETKLFIEGKIDISGIVTSSSRQNTNSRIQKQLSGNRFTDDPGLHSTMSPSTTNTVTKTHGRSDPDVTSRLLATSHVPKGEVQTTVRTLDTRMTTNVPFITEVYNQLEKDEKHKRKSKKMTQIPVTRYSQDTNFKNVMEMYTTESPMIKTMKEDELNEKESINTEGIKSTEIVTTKRQGITPKLHTNAMTNSKEKTATESTHKMTTEKINDRATNEIHTPTTKQFEQSKKLEETSTKIIDKAKEELKNEMNQINITVNKIKGHVSTTLPTTEKPSRLSTVENRRTYSGTNTDLNHSGDKDDILDELTAAVKEMLGAGQNRDTRTGNSFRETLRKIVKEELINLNCNNNKLDIKAEKRNPVKVESGLKNLTGVKGEAGKKGDPGRNGANGRQEKPRQMGERGDPGYNQQKAHVILTQNDLLQMEDMFSVGSFALVSSTDNLFIKSLNGWLKVNTEKTNLYNIDSILSGSGVLFKKRSNDELDKNEYQNIQKLYRPTKLDRRLMKYNLILPPENKLARRPYLLMIALNKPYPGQMKGLVNMDYKCVRQARQSGYRNHRFRAFLADDFRGINDIVPKDLQHLPIANVRGEQLFHSIDTIYGMNNYSTFNPRIPIYSFSMKDVRSDHNWPIKKIWHGAVAHGHKHHKNKHCNNWKSDDPYKKATAASIITYTPALNELSIRCNQKLIVLCIQVSS